MVSASDVRSLIGQILEDPNRKARLEALADLDDLYAAQVLDSLGTVQLVAALEQAYLISLEAEDVFSDAFVSLDGISKLVQARRSTEQRS